MMIANIIKTLILQYFIMKSSTLAVNPFWKWMGYTETNAPSSLSKSGSVLTIQDLISNNKQSEIIIPEAEKEYLKRLVSVDDSVYYYGQKLSVDERERRAISWNTIDQVVLMEGYESERAPSMTSSVDGSVIYLKRGDHLDYRYELLDQIGQGGQASIFRVFDHKEQMECVLKLFVAPDNLKHKLHSATRSSSSNVYEIIAAYFENEVAVLKLIRDRTNAGDTHLPSILDYGNLRAPSQNQYIISPLYPGITLFELRRKLSGKRPAEILSIIRRVFQQLLQGLQVLSGLNIVHADIKPQNIIVSDDDEYQVHLIDFGSSIIIEGLRVNDRNIGGTFAYCPPDMFLGKRLTHKSDVWTLALTISELLFQKEQSATLIAPLIKSEMNPQGFLKKRLDFLGPPSQSRSPNIYDSVPFKLAFKEWKTLRGNAKSFASLNSKYSKEYQLSSATEYKSLIRLLETLLDWDRDERPTAEEALKHEFFRPTKHQNSF